MSIITIEDKIQIVALVLDSIKLDYPATNQPLNILVEAVLDDIKLSMKKNPLSEILLIVNKTLCILQNNNKVCDIDAKDESISLEFGNLLKERHVMITGMGVELEAMGESLTKRGVEMDAKHKLMDAKHKLREGELEAMGESLTQRGVEIKLREGELEAMGESLTNREGELEAMGELLTQREVEMDAKHKLHNNKSTKKKRKFMRLRNDIINPSTPLVNLRKQRRKIIIKKKIYN